MSGRGRAGQNRKPKCAPIALLGLSKTTLADLVWDLAGTAPGVESCDDPADRWRAVFDRREPIGDPADLRRLYSKANKPEPES